MIFVTVGTHEQPFDRLVKCVDDLVKAGTIKEEVIVQTGYCTYEPVHCTHEKLLPHDKMAEYVHGARIVITHGGPASFIMPLQEGKIPIVVPRRKEFGEHVNDHQAEFAAQVAERNRNIIVVNDIAELGGIITRYDEICAGLCGGETSHTAEFLKRFTEEVTALMEK